MGVETFTDIASLNALWPLGSDSKSEGDNHLRGIKSVLKTEFPTGSAPYLKATAQARSRIVNGAMQISGENGNTLSTASATYPADQFYGQLVTAAPISIQRVQSVTPNGSKDRIRLIATTGAASVLAAYYAAIVTPIEGIRVADFRWGSASARQIILRFGWKAPAGTYSVALQNSAQNRSYVANFIIAAGQANTDTEQTVIIPGDTTGTWLTDTGRGINLFFGVVCGTDRQGVTGWQSAEKLGTASNSNGFLTTGNTFEVFDVGLYLDADATGLAPKWQMPDEAQELQACKRYWHREVLIIDAGGPSQSLMFQTEMRAVPAVTGGGAGFNSTMASWGSTQMWQTARAGQTITFNARM